VCCRLIGSPRVQESSAQGWYNGDGGAGFKRLASRAKRNKKKKQKRICRKNRELLARGWAPEKKSVTIWECKYIYIYIFANYSYCTQRVFITTPDYGIARRGESSAASCLLLIVKPSSSPSLQHSAWIIFYTVLNFLAGSCRGRFFHRPPGASFPHGFLQRRRRRRYAAALFPKKIN